MAQSIACPNCRAKLFAPPDVYGQPVRCTNCKRTFTASVAHSPYLEDLPEPPKDRRNLIMAGGVVLTLLIALGSVLLYNYFTDDEKPKGGIAKSEDEVKTKEPLPKEKLSQEAQLAALERAVAARIAEEEAANKPKEKKALTDATISKAGWEVSPGVRQLVIEYTFHPPSTPANGNYSLVVTFDGNRIATIPLAPNTPASGRMPFKIDELLSTPPTKLPKVEVWIEKAGGIGGTKASNVGSSS